MEHSNITGSSTGRDESGLMHIDWVRRDVVKVYLTYQLMTASELQYMINLMQGKEFTFTYRDRGSTKTASCYVGETSYEFYSYGLNNEELYQNVEIHVIEK